MKELQDICFDTSSWQRYCYEKAKLAVGSELASVEQTGKNKFGAWPAWQRELFSRLYAKPPKKSEVEPGLEWASKAHEEADQLPEWQRLQARTSGDTFASRIAATTVAESVLEALKDVPPQRQNPQDLAKKASDIQELIGDIEAAGRDPSKAKAVLERVQRALARALQQGANAAGSMDPSKIRQAFRAATETANEKITKAEEGLAGFGWDLSDPKNRSIQGIDEKTALAEMLLRFPKLKQLAELAGKFRTIAARKQRQKAKHGCDEVSDLEQGSDLGRILPAEMVKLLRPGLRQVFQRDFLEHQCQQYRLASKKEKGKGPIIFCIDGSGSMEHPFLGATREIWSKAIFMAMLTIAKMQKRDAVLIHWSTDVDRVDFFRHGQYTPMELLTSMQFFANGGTRIQPCLVKAAEILNQYSEFKQADLIIITDGCFGSLDPTFAAFFKNLKWQLSVNVYGMMVGELEKSPVFSTICEPNKPVNVMSVLDQRDIMDSLFEI